MKINFGFALLAYYLVADCNGLSGHRSLQTINKPELHGRIQGGNPKFIQIGLGLLCV